MNRKFICVICPNGCEIEAVLNENEIVSLNGARCKRGKTYVEQELTCPMRTFSTSILVEGGELPLVSVRLTKPIPKGKIFEVNELIHRQRVQAPVYSGQIILKNVLDLGSDVIITKDVARAT